MSREDMHRMFTDLAEDVDPPAFASAAWARARMVRRRMAAGATAVAVLAVLGAVGVTARGHHGPRPAPPIGTPTSSPRLGKVDVLPEHIPDRPDGFLPPSFAPPADAPPLSARRFQVVVALYSPPIADFDGLPPIYVYGRWADGTGGWARLPVALVWATDGANRSLPMRATSLGPGGRWAVFPQPGGVVVVDLTTGAAHTVAMSGLMREIAWLPDGVHAIVSGGDASYLVDVASGAVTAAKAQAQDVVTLYSGSDGTVTWTGDTTLNEPLVVTRYDDAGAHVVRRTVVEQSTIAPYGIDEMYGPSSRRGHTLVRAGFGRNATESGGQYVAAVDEVSGSITRMLSVGFDVQKGCCGILGWSGDAVVFSVAGRGVLAWNPVDGSVYRLAPATDGLISIAAYGCDWEITIAGTGTACRT